MKAVLISIISLLAISTYADSCPDYNGHYRTEEMSPTFKLIFEQTGCETIDISYQNEGELPVEFETIFTDAKMRKIDNDPYWSNSTHFMIYRHTQDGLSAIHFLQHLGMTIESYDKIQANGDIKRSMTIFNNDGSKQDIEWLFVRVGP